MTALVLALLLGAGASPPDYGKARWGLTLTEVRKLVPGLKGTSGRLSGATEVMDRPARIEYVFVRDRLAAVELLLTTTQADPGGYLLEYDRLREGLEGPLGHGDAHTEWSDEQFQKDADGDRAGALAAGHLRLRTVWESARTRVSLSCGSEDADVALRLAYESRVVAPEPKPTPKPKAAARTKPTVKPKPKASPSPKASPKPRP